jgi:dienelactone hydrolase
MEKPVAFQNENRLVGTLNLPENGDGDLTGVVFLHGWSGYRSGPHRMFVNTARHLAEEGIASLRFDLRGRGDSGGDKEQTNLDDMISDTLAAKKLLADEAKVSKPVLLGICSGGNVSIGSASLDKDIAGLVLWSTPLFAAFKKASDKSTKRRMMLMEYFKKAIRPSTWIRLIKGQVNVGMVGKAISGEEEKKDGKGRNPKDSLRDIMSDLKGYKGPILFIYGTNDDEVIGAPEFCEKYCQENGIDVTVRFIDGANHNFYSIDWEKQVLDVTTEWLKQKVG